MAVPLLVAGCDVLSMYLDPYGLPPGGFGAPLGIEYTRGTATLKITQDGVTETVELRLAPYSTYDPTYGAYATWESAEWSVSISAYDVTVPGVAVMTGDVSMTFGVGTTFWTAGSYIPVDAGNKCAVHIWEMTATKLEGRVNCTALRWVDGMDYDMAYVDGEEPFEVGIDFNAEAPEDPPGQTS